MRKWENGKYYDMSPEEIAEMERLAAEMPEPELMPEERLAALERALAERDAIITELMTKMNEGG